MASTDQAEISAAKAIGITAAEDDEHHGLVLTTVEPDNLANASVRDADVVQASEGSQVLGGCFESPHMGATAGATEKILPVLKFTLLSRVFARLGSIP